jgi:hypothetical protein
MIANRWNMTLDQLDARWRSLDRSIEATHDLIKQYNALYRAAMTNSYKIVLGGQITSLSAQVSALLREQSEVEMFLIENEAKGWTST